MLIYLDMEFISSLLEYVNNAFSFEPALMLTIVLRTILVAGILLFIIKWIGGKGLSQLNPYQLIIILGLGNVVAEPMVNSDFAILSMVIIIFIIVIFFKVIDYITTKNKKIERILEPHVTELVKDGKIDEKGMMRARIGEEEYLSLMRLAGIRRIEDIELSNLEMNGQISFIQK
jgi:uncharacterized membrane protein YcaP (DUF421 family)